MKTGRRGGYDGHMEIQKARRRDIPGLAELLTQGFLDDPVLTEYVARSRDPERALERFFTTELEKFYIPRGVVDIVKDEGKLKGAALWVSPDAPIRRRDSLKMMPGLVRALGRGLPRALRLDYHDSSAVPGFPHWYLYTVVVSASARGQGVGGALLDHGIARAGDSAIYLESTTPGSQRLYERKGFVPLGVIPSPSPAPEVGMWKPGRAGTVTP